MLSESVNLKKLKKNCLDHLTNYKFYCILYLHTDHVQIFFLKRVVTFFCVFQLFFLEAFMAPIVGILIVAALIKFLFFTKNK